MSKYVLQVEKGRSIQGYTRVRVLPETHQRLMTICNITGKTLQDAVDELLNYAMNNTEIYNGDTKINIKI